MEKNVRDPREIITPESFAVDPGLLGLPLARPRRRAAAMGIDLVLIALLVWAGGFLFGVAAAWAFLRISTRTAGGGVMRRSGRFLFRAAAALTLFLVVMSAVGSWRRSQSADPREPVPAIEEYVAAADLEAFRSARTETEGARAAGELARQLRESGISTPAIRTMLGAAADPELQPWARAVARRAARGELEISPEQAAAADSLLALFAAAWAARDSAALAGLRPAVKRIVATDTLAAVEVRLQALAGENRRLRAERDDARTGRGLLSFLRKSADDLGLTFGWSGLYFTAFLALWNGQTPGKRMLRLRVVRLDGKPMTWWASFERFGGYAASLVTGLLGFVQIVWDRNRQGMHDKITETVVVIL
jgi:uncharacterized RDD family membrane protein YckC